ncbi:MAG: DUF1573 domain-containing protein [Chlorobi bacterium]|nr:DUF1573 domain-containing protein [Chlorobiota bacterium]
MKQNLYIFLIFTGILFLPGNKPVTIHNYVNLKSVAKAPIMHFEETSFDFGVIRAGTEAKHVFTFKNKGSQPLVIANVRSSCGCTTPVWTREPVRKNKKGTIAVKYNTNIWGKFRKSITVISNAENSPIILVIRGEVKYIPENKSKKIK